MTSENGTFDAWLDEMAAATDRLLMSVDRMSPGDVGAPSRLPGWSRGHLLTHVARSADAMVNLVWAARTGDGRPMYPGAPDARETAIEQGAGRHLGDLRLDLSDTADRLLEAFAGFPAEARDRQVTMRGGRVVLGGEIPLVRVREVEIHHVDLDAGYAPADWSEEFARRTLDQLAGLFRDERDCPVRTLVATDVDGRWEVGAGGPELAGPVRELAAWLTGRADGGRLTSSAGGEVPRAPRWS